MSVRFQNAAVLQTLVTAQSPGRRSFTVSICTRRWPRISMHCTCRLRSRAATTARTRSNRFAALRLHITRRTQARTQTAMETAHKQWCNGRWVRTTGRGPTIDWSVSRRGTTTPRRQSEPVCRYEASLLLLFHGCTSVATKPASLPQQTQSPSCVVDCRPVAACYGNCACSSSQG